MNDPRHLAHSAVTGWLDQARRRPLRPDECWQLVESVGLVPGMLRPCVQALSCQRDAAAVDALLALPPNVPGLAEALYAAFASGVVRPRVDGTPSTPMFALDFRRGKARGFQDIVQRAQQVFGDGLELLDVDHELFHRVCLDGARGTLAGRVSAAAYDLQWLHERLSKLKGTRLWINGWRFDDVGPVRPSVAAYLLRGWISWASRQVVTQAGRGR